MTSVKVSRNQNAPRITEKRIYEKQINCYFKGAIIYSVQRALGRVEFDNENKKIRKNSNENHNVPVLKGSIWIRAFLRKRTQRVNRSERVKSKVTMTAIARVSLVCDDVEPASRLGKKENAQYFS